MIWPIIIVIGKRSGRKKKIRHTTACALRVYGIHDGIAILGADYPHHQFFVPPPPALPFPAPANRTPRSRARISPPTVRQKDNILIRRFLRKQDRENFSHVFFKEFSGPRRSRWLFRSDGTTQRALRFSRLPIVFHQKKKKTRDKKETFTLSCDLVGPLFNIPTIRRRVERLIFVKPSHFLLFFYTRGLEAICFSEKNSERARTSKRLFRAVSNGS